MKTVLITIFATLAVWRGLFGGVSATLAAQIDFGSTEGTSSTCARFRNAQPSRLANDDEKVAYVVCEAIQLARQIATWRRVNFPERSPAASGSMADLVNSARRELSLVLSRIQNARKVLETVALKKPSFVLSPGSWTIDLDEDGKISQFERHFFWVPRPNVSIFQQPPANEAALADYYRKQYASPSAKPDQSDVLWAIAYCHFAEFAIHTVLSYEIGGTRQLEVWLVNADRVKNAAHRSLIAGMNYSKRLRQSLLRETDDDLEWIPNPSQRNTSFPLKLDQQSFATWGKILDHVEELLNGRTLLGGKVLDPSGRELGGITFDFCPPGEGINIRDLFNRPMLNPLFESQWKQRCIKATKALPMSTLHKSLSEIFARNAPRNREEPSAEWAILRHLYWVN